MFIQPHDPDFVPEPIYPEYIELEDVHILPDEEQPLPPADGSVDYPIDGGDDGDDDDGDSSGDDATDEYEDDEDDKEEEEHLAPADSAATISFPPKAEVERLLAMPTPSPSPSPLTSLSQPSTGERLARCMAPAALPSQPLPSPLHMPPPVDRRDDIPETEMLPRKRLCLSTLGSRYKVRESSTARPIEGRGIHVRNAIFNSI
nr:hypothetical protein [Tanacetum cinerariifolium]